MPRHGLALLVSGVILAACGGSDGTDPTPQPDPVVVTVTPSRDTLTVGTSTTFAAAVSGTTDPTVSWRVQEASGGAVTSAGAYTAGATPGTFHVIASSVAEPSSSDTAAVQVVAAPNANITAPTDVGTGIAGQSASVPAQSGATYLWSISGGSITSGTASASIAFTAGAVGTLTLQCTVTNLAGTAQTGSKSVTIQPVPSITSFTASEDTVTTGQTVSLTAVFTGGTGAVNQGVGGITSGVAVTTGPVSGSPSYTLTVTSPYGPTATASVTVVGIAAPAVLRFGAMQRVVGAGDSAYLIAEYTYYTSTGSISPGIGAVGTELLKMSPPIYSNTTFVLTVTNLADSTVTASWPVAVEPKAPGSFLAAGQDSGARYAATATLLGNGLVLVAGGDQAGGTALLYNPATHAFTPTGQMVEARSEHAAIRLGDGRVLVTGAREFDAQATAEIYDPATGTFSPTGNMTTRRWFHHTMTLLGNGKVLVVGGDAWPVGGTAELYDPATGTFTATGSLVTPWRHFFSAVPLQDGRVLILLGQDQNQQGITSAEAYDPVTGTFSSIGSLVAAHLGGTATLLGNGKVLVAGGTGVTTSPTNADYGHNVTAEIFDPNTNQFSTTGSLAFPRWYHSATLLANGKVLLAYGDHLWGGGPGFLRVPSSELYDVATGSFHPGPTVPDQQGTLRGAAIRLPSGAVVFFTDGGFGIFAEQFQ